MYNNQRKGGYQPESVEAWESSRKGSWEKPEEENRGGRWYNSILIKYIF